MRLNVMYSTDENYSQHAMASMISLLENNKDFSEIFIYLVENKLNEITKKQIINIIEEYSRNIIFIPIEEICRSLNKNDEFPISAYARLFISNIDCIDKILYLDCDTIVNDSLASLWNINLDKYLVAGVQDNPAVYMVNIIGMASKDRYLNSGVLLINLKEWRSCNIEQKFVDFIKKYNGLVPHHDQGVINGVCKDKILILNPKYNMMPEMIYLNEKKIKKLYNILEYYTEEEINSAVKNPCIIHYISKFYNRPWNEQCNHPMKDLYKYYLEKFDIKYYIRKSNIDKGTLYRRFIFEHMPFSMYCLTEKVLNIKRKMYLKNKYKFLNIKF